MPIETQHLLNSPSRIVDFSRDAYTFNVIQHRLEQDFVPNAPIAQLDRATDYESVCREFESLWARQ